VDDVRIRGTIERARTWIKCPESMSEKTIENIESQSTSDDVEGEARWTRDLMVRGMIAKIKVRDIIAGRRTAIEPDKLRMRRRKE